MDNNNDLNNSFESEKFSYKEDYNFVLPKKNTISIKNLHENLINHAKNGNLEEIRKLSGNAFGFNIKEEALTAAIENNHLEIVEYLINHEHGLHTVNYFKLRKVAFKESVKHCNLEIFEYLINDGPICGSDGGTDIDLLNDLFNLLPLEINDNNIKIAHYLIDNGANDSRSNIERSNKIESKNVNVIDGISNKFEEKLENEIMRKTVGKKSYFNFNIFKNLGTYINNLMLSSSKNIKILKSVTSSSEDKNMTTEQKILFSKINTLISNNILTEVIRIEKSGYVLTKNQKINFEKALEDNLINGKVNQIRDLLSESYKIPLPIFAKWILNTKANDEERDLFANELKYVWKDVDIINQTLIEWEKELTIHLERAKVKSNEKSNLDLAYYQDETRNFIKTINKVVSIFGKIEEVINIDDYMKILSLIKETIDIHKDYLMESKNKQTKEYLKMSYNTVLSLINTTNPTVDKMTEQINSFYQNKRVKEKQLFKVEIKELSYNTKQLLENLNKEIDECKKEREKIPDYEWERLESLWKVNLNKALNEYSAMSVEAKETLKNVEKKSAEELLDETIIHISDILNNKLLEINEDRLSNLSVGQRHIKSLKNSF